MRNMEPLTYKTYTNRTTTAFVPKDTAIKMNFYRNYYLQTDPDEIAAYDFANYPVGWGFGVPDCNGFNIKA